MFHIIDSSSNDFSGDIPDIIGNMIGLVSLVRLCINSYSYRTVIVLVEISGAVTLSFQYILSSSSLNKIYRIIIRNT